MTAGAVDYVLFIEKRKGERTERKERCGASDNVNYSRRHVPKTGDLE